MNPDNIHEILEIVKALRKTNRRFWIVGGAITFLYVEEEYASKIRPTKDIDCIVEVLNYTSFAGLESDLRNIDFEHDAESDIICRWKFKGITVDVIPSESGNILGFTNSWYKDGMENSIKKQIEDIEISYFPLCYFLASKIEAFNSRGKGDYYGSEDFEDIVFLLDGVKNLKEFYTFPPKVIIYLKTQFALMLNDKNFESALYGHLDQSPVRDGRAERIIGFLKEFTLNKFD
jgi:hypothetical protein